MNGQRPSGPPSLSSAEMSKEKACKWLRGSYCAADWCSMCWKDIAMHLLSLLFSCDLGRQPEGGHGSSFVHGPPFAFLNIAL